MIDFRYHLVSLVAVFIALAVGIALGAGPLREGLSSTLESEVSQLREERGELRDEVAFADRRAEAGAQGVERLAGRGLEGTLQGVRVGVVVLAGADRNAQDRLETQLDRAGAIVAIGAEVSDDWTTPPADDPTFLDRLAAPLEVPQLDGAGGSGEPTVPTLLAAVLSGADRPGQLGAWLAVGADLEQAGLVDLTWRGGTADEFTDRRPPDALIVLSGGLDAAAAAEPEGQTRLAAKLELVSGLAALDMPLVVAGQGAERRATTEDDTLDPLVAAVRGERDLTDLVSTVDNLESLTGQVAAALALAWALEGQHGHYGLGALAQGSMPAVPAPRLPDVGVGVEPTPPVDENTDPAGTDPGADLGTTDPGTDPADPGTGAGGEPGESTDATAATAEP